MKALLVLYLANFLVLIYTNPFDELDNDETPGKIHSLYQKHYLNYKKYLKKFSKKHDTSVPEPIRLLKFAQNMKMIKKHNERYRKGLESYKQSLNEMSDWTEEEKKRLFGFSLNATEIKEANMSQLLGSKLKKAIPRYVDYRKTVSKTPVGNQGSCRICYIFAALSGLEMHIALKNKKPPVELSVQDVLDCSPFQKCYGGGGDLTQVYDWVSENGVTTSEKYPYKGNDSVSCPSEERSTKIIKAGLAGGISLPRDNEEILRRALAVYGPVTVSLYATQSNFISYESGIYDDPDCPSAANRLNHAVLAVGYGVKNGKKYFIIRNSWGPSWGRKGYGYIRAGVFMCGIGHYSSIPLFL